MATPSEGLLDPYSADPIDRGFWLMFGAAAEAVFGLHFWNPRGVEDRERCIRALPRRYRALFEPMLFGPGDCGASAM